MLLCLLMAGGRSGPTDFHKRSESIGTELALKEKCSDD